MAWFENAAAVRDEIAHAARTSKRAGRQTAAGSTAHLRKLCVTRCWAENERRRFAIENAHLKRVELVCWNANDELLEKCSIYAVHRVRRIHYEMCTMSVQSLCNYLRASNCKQLSQVISHNTHTHHWPHCFATQTHAMWSRAGWMLGATSPDGDGWWVIFELERPKRDATTAIVLSTHWAHT